MTLIQIENQCLRELTREGAPITGAVRDVVHRCAAAAFARGQETWEDSSERATPVVLPRTRTLRGWRP